MKATNLDPGTANRWYRRSPELTWVVQPGKGRYAQRFDLLLGCLVNESANTIGWNLDPTYPRPNQCHLYSDFAFMEGPLPATQSAARFDSHAPYFTMAFTLVHAIIDDAERELAIQTAVDEIDTLTATTVDVESLTRMIGVRKRNSFIHRDLKNVAKSSDHGGNNGLS